MGTEPDFVVDWRALGRRFPPSLIYTLRAKLINGSSTTVEPTLLAVETGVSEADVVAFLGELAGAGAVEKVIVARCPVDSCGHILAGAEVSAGECPQCGTVFQQEGLTPVQAVEYRIEAEVSRGVSWLLAVHGFNTRGEWQEEVSWRIANKYRRRAPVLNYKFGLVRPGVLFRTRHRQLAAQLGRRIGAARAFAIKGGIEEPPDLVLHSFGTLLFATLLTLHEFDDLNFGRIILCGSIIRPDYAWTQHIDAGRIEAIFNHCGLHDWPVQIAGFAIPEAGPSGHSGFNDPAVLNLMSNDYGHGTFFEQSALAANLGEGGVWDRFLRYPSRSLRSIGETFEPKASWSTLPRWLLAVIRWLAIGATSAIIARSLCWGVRWLCVQLL